MGTVYLALTQIRYQAGRSLLFCIIIALLITIPLLTQVLSRMAESQLLARADASPLVYAPPGSPLDSTLSLLFFEGEANSKLTMADYELLLDFDLGLPLPVLRAGSARGFPVVGINIDYLEFRDLVVSEGRPFVRLGEAVLGAEVARRLNVKPGMRIQTDVTRIFELAGAYPVRMEVTGILAPEGTPDDRAVFVDTRTAWVVAGFGHGHQDLTRTDDTSVILRRDASKIIANAKLKQYIEITDENRNSFHFHGEPANFPLSGLIIKPNDTRSAALLRGRVEDQGTDRQIFRPGPVIQKLLNEVFRVQSILNLLIAVVAVAAVMALVMLIGLSLKLRRREFEIARQIGADRFAVQRQIALELMLIFVAALAISTAIAGFALTRGEAMLRYLLFGG
jgi:putative ABC transport system permease protein